jgi:hypothetical protein
MDTTRHTIAVTLNLADGETLEPAPVTVEGEPFDLTNEAALDLVLPEGSAPTRLDFASVPGFVRFGATIVPADRFRSLSATVIASSRPNTPEEQAAFDAAREGREA